MENLFDCVFDRHSVGTPPRLLHKRCLWVVEHTRTEAHSSFVTREDVVVATTLTTLPELVVLRKLRECYRLVTKTSIQLHHWQRCCDTEQLGERKTHTRQLEGALLNLASQTQVAILWVYNQTRSGNIVTVSPALDITKSDKFITCKSDNCLTTLNLRGDIFW